jgi:hypothetical protein
MKDSTISYRRLPGSGRGLATHDTLWEASDHVLMVRSSPVGERYRRFYFHDIQAFFLRPNRRGMWNRILFGVPMLIAGSVAAASEGTLAIVCWGGAVVFAVLLLADFIRGRTCDCYVKTAVQTERLTSLARLRKAEKVLERLRPLVREAQQARTTESD